MLGILTLQKNIQKELEKLIKNVLSILLIQKKLHQKIKSLLVILIIMELSFPCKKKILARLRWKAIYASMCLVMQMSWFFDSFMFYKTKNKNKKWFYKSCLQCFSSENVLTKHKEDCLSINGKQSVKLEEGTIEFENYFKQIPVSFKIYADFECN